MTTISAPLRLALVSILAAIAAFTSAAPAAAAPITTQGCQVWDARATLYYEDGTQSNYTCSGTYFPPAKAPNVFYARGWSGYFVQGSLTVYFCDGFVWGFSTTQPVSKLYLSPYKASWC